MSDEQSYIFLQSEFVQEIAPPSPVHARDRDDGGEVFVGATVRVVGLDWFGKLERWKTFDNVNLNHPLSKEICDYWNEHCTWYQIYGGHGPLDRLRARLNELLDRRAALLRQAPTDIVRNKLAKLERRKCCLEEELAFMEAGYVARKPFFSWHGTDIKLEEPLSAVVPANTPQIEISVVPGRIGLGPGIVLLVSCVGRKKVGRVDEFTTWLPCLYEGHHAAEAMIQAYGYPGEDYADITMKDLQDALQKIFCRRRPEFEVQDGGTMLQYCGRRLEDEERAESIFLHYEGEGLYTERIDIVMDLVQPEPEQQPGGSPQQVVEAAVSDTLRAVVGSVASTF